jgi:hypothetical protein
MKTLQYKIITSIALLFITVSAAQKQEQKATEKFSVNKNVVIDVNTRYTDIEIETWNKNEVVVDAYLVIEGAQDQKVIDEYLNTWNFEALGNKSTIKINSKSSGLIDIHSFNFDAPNYDIIISESVSDALENLHFEMPDMPEIPEIPEIPEMPEIREFDFNFDVDGAFDFVEFDFDAYKKDKKYLEKWKELNKDVLKGVDVKIGKNSIFITTDKDNLSKEDLEKREEQRQKRMNERQRLIEDKVRLHQERMKERQKELQGRIKERDEEHKLALIKRQEAQEKRAKEMIKYRIEVRDILAKREKVKIKRIIKIKAPKDAKFNMNVRYGSMSFPK